MSQIEPSGVNHFVNTIARANLFLRKEYLQCLDQTKILGMQDHDTPSHANLRLLRIDTLLYEAQDDISDKLKGLFGAVESYGESILLLLDGKKDRINIYLGVSCQQPPHPVYATFQRSLSGLFPGCKYRTLHNEAIDELMDSVFPNDEPIHISAISAFPDEKGAVTDRREKLDALIDGMKRRPFSMLLIAKAIPQDDLSAMQQFMYQLYSELSSLERMTLTLSKSDAETMGESFSKAVTNTLGYSASISRGHSITKGSSVSEQTAPNNEELKNHQSILQLAGAAASLLLPTAMGMKDVNMLQSLFFGSSISNILSSGEQVLGLAPTNVLPSTTVSTHEDRSENENEQVSENKGYSVNAQAGANYGQSVTLGQTQQTTKINKAISEMLVLLEKQIRQLSSYQQEGAFHTAAYFVAGDSETAITAANMYRSICESSRLPSLHSPIYSWYEATQIAVLKQYLARGLHPVFSFRNNSPDFPYVQAAQMIGLSDMSSYFCFPEHSLPGLIVSPVARFSRDIIAAENILSNDEQRSVRIGCIRYMGKEEEQTPVNLSVNELTKHLFVSGATGVGKSNFCYHLLDQLDQQGIKMLIIEPAKGEYRQVLGGREGFRVFCADPRRGPVLRINPFAYPEGVSTIQHIERLLDIFNAAWAMYSAMPAILKEAVEMIYVEKGFDLLNGTKPAQAQFPCFQDLLEALPRIVNQSAYSNEVKGNYIGALATRIRSLTNGIYSVIFSQDEIGDDVLFNANVIVDISTIGSMETKSLVMGVLIARLVECRMAEGRINSPLRHVTLLEEAHNLLRRHNNASTDGSNIRAASVEMIASAIAEMRSSGEGFIISDQSPSVMDWSVIRNTQTKVFFMLPDREDRLIAANALSLSDVQQQEIARLSTGVAAVYQNGWTDAVLCKIDRFDEDRSKPFVFHSAFKDSDRTALMSQAVSVLLCSRIGSGKSDVNEETIKRLVKCDPNLLDPCGKAALELLKNHGGPLREETSLMNDFIALNRIIPIARIVRNASQASNIYEWTSRVEQDVLSYVSISSDEIQLAVSLGLREWSVKNPNAKKLYVRYLAYYLERKNRRIAK